jgi:hypothetical protein
VKLFDLIDSIDISYRILQAKTALRSSGPGKPGIKKTGKYRLHGILFPGSYAGPSESDKVFYALTQE